MRTGSIRPLFLCLIVMFSATGCASIGSVKEIRGNISDIFARLSGHDEKISTLEKNVIELALADDTLFKSGSATLNEGAIARLSKVSQILNDHAGVYILLDGHTDNRGSERHNLQLSKNRAETVADVIREGGFPADHIQVMGHGESTPMASNLTSEGRKLNRRVGITIAGSKDELMAHKS